MLGSQPLSTKPLVSLHSDDASMPASSPELGNRIHRALQGIQHGQLTIVVHDGQVVQIDRLIRVRHFRSPRRT